KNIVGNIYHNLIVEEKTQKREDGSIVWKCRCLKCGNYIEATKKQLDRGYVKDCGNHKYDDLLRQKIGDLTVISFDKIEKNIFVYVLVVSLLMFLDLISLVSIH